MVNGGNRILDIFDEMGKREKLGKVSNEHQPSAKSQSKIISKSRQRRQGYLNLVDPTGSRKRKCLN